MNRIPTLLFSAVLICLASCKKDSSIGGPNPTDVFFVSDAASSQGITPATSVTPATTPASNPDSASTKTTVSSDGRSVKWAAEDALALWASDEAGQAVFSNQKFVVYGMDDGRAVFTSTLEAPMEEGTYTYVATYPQPASLSGTIASFNIPANQDGTAANGEDVMVSSRVKASELSTMARKSAMQLLNLEMHHLTHLLKFYLPAGSDGLNGEPVNKIEMSLSSGGAGHAYVDVANPESPAAYSSSSISISLDLSKELSPSSPSARQYAFASVLPAEYTDGDFLNIRLFSKKYTSTLAPVSLTGRNFAAGHSTPVALNITEVEPFYHVNVNYIADNIGEPVQKITLTAPTGCKWGDDGSNVYTIAPSGDISVGTGIQITYRNASDFRTLSGKTITVTYDSKHIQAKQYITLPSLDSRTETSMDLTAPYLLDEDFSSVGSFSSNDSYSGGSIAGDMSAYSFLNGWTAARAGASQGQCIRIAGRRETSARYAARADSAPLPTIKSRVNLEVSFTYGTNNQYGGLGSGDYGSYTYVGYVTSTNAYSSSDTTGNFESSNVINTNAKDGSYDATPNSASFTLTNVAPGTSVRISWRNEVESHAGANNTTTWFYIDNIKVRVKQ